MVSEPSVVRYLQGARMRGLTIARIEQALRRLRLSAYVRNGRR